GEATGGRAGDGEQPVATDADDDDAVEAPETRPATRRAPRQRWLVWQARRAKQRRIGSLDADSGYLFELELDNRAAGLRTVRLTNYYETVADKRLAAEDPARYARVLAEERQKPRDQRKYQGRYRVVTPVAADEGELLSLATDAVTMRTRHAGTVTVNLRKTSRWQFAPVREDRAVLTWRLDRQLHTDPSQPSVVVPYLELRKTYEIAENDYSIKVTLEAVNLLTPENFDERDGQTPLKRPLSDEQRRDLEQDAETMEVSLEQSGPVGVPREDPRSDGRHLATGRVVDIQAGTVEAELTARKKFLEKNEAGKRVEVGRSGGGEPVVWIGAVNKYFGAMTYLVPPQDENGRTLHAPGYDAKFYFASFAQGCGTGTEVPFRAVRPGDDGALRVRYDTFAGPKRRRLFSGEGDLPARPLYRKLAYRDTVSTRSCFCAFGWLTRPMMWLLDQLSFVNYGVAIILLVAVVRLVLHPLTKKGQVSMMKMQKLAPQMQKLKEKHKGDKETLNREMMNLYKQAGATPILGCLPMILQMPIWVALFTGLNSAVELRHAAFLPVWITDLAAPDALIRFGYGVSLPLIGWTPGLNLLPILVAVAMLLNVKMNPQSQTGAGGDQAKQAKMMMYFMPAMMLFIFYNMPSGLNLYIMTSTFAGVAEQKVIRRHIKQREQEQAQRETTVSMPGKKARSQRPKKPKGPFWYKQG
ncbi:MAG: membrane protein insertase YidC, partial [Planctomycetota bacterium]